MDKSMKIIVEGCDGCGKTTLINNIIKSMPFMNFKTQHFSTTTSNNYYNFLSQINSEGNIIFDRFHLGQMVYQSEKERIDRRWLTDNEFSRIESLIANRNDIICLYVETDLDTAFWNCQHNGEDTSYTKEYVKEIQYKYRNLIRDLNLKYGNHWITYNNNYDFFNKKARTIDWGSLPKSVAVDFDGVIASTSFPTIYRANHILINELVNGKYKDYVKVLWTNRTGIDLYDAVEFCKLNGFTPDYVNENIKELKNHGLDPRKIYCDYYIDDRAIEHSFNDIEFTISSITI